MKEIKTTVEQVGLAKTLGPGSIIFMGIASLIGGGIFTLLAPAVSLSGPGLFLGMLLGSSIAFLNLQMYLALGTTFPEAGGGYLWVRKGLGNFQGFLAGWFSWFAHASACGVYALSLGFYAFELLRYAGADRWVTDPEVARKVITVLFILFFGFLNWRGTKLTGKAGMIIGSVLLTVLTAFIVSGLAKMAFSPAPLANFSPLLPNGLFGILAAVSVFYIAFEGSEIQVQAGEEARNPERDIKISLITAWGIVTTLYLFISVVVVGAMPHDGMVWRTLGGYGDEAIIRAAQAFMPYGRLLMVFAGFLANLAALNDTIFSSSHVSFALARDKNVWSRLAHIHEKNFTPHVAVIASVSLIVVMVLALPLFDVASAASLLFVLLFLQLNWAGINIHFKYPETKWKYRVPLFPVVPIVAIALYALLALTMLRINIVAWMVTMIWLLLGLVNYFAYAEAKGREDFESEIVYEEAMHIRPKCGRRILLPIGPGVPHDEVRRRADVAIALAGHAGGEIVVARIHVVPQVLRLLDGATMSHDRQEFEMIREMVERYNADRPGIDNDVGFHSLVMMGRDVTAAILDVVRQEQCDLLLLSWKGYTHAKGTVFGSKIDRILRESRCDLLVLKDPQPIKSLLLAANPKGKNPDMRRLGEVFMALTAHHRPRRELVCVIGGKVPAYFKTDATAVLESLGLREDDFDEIKFKTSDSIVGALVEEAEAVKPDVVLLGAAKRKPLKDIRFGRIPESLARHLDSSVYIFRGHRGIATAFRERIFRRFWGDHS